MKNSFLKIIDLFGEPVKMNFDDRETIRTKLGGFFTILCPIIVTVFSWFIGKDIIYKVNPFYYQQSMTYDSHRTVE
jgi:hypothetical protein